ncbi:hypothetical protein L198_04632 [Cryptococcus wingfieldii CBS 7118]|uniref:Uncharacterized protein n=1 Tax=Cryptococcus wingfieldii CBS 7118 TaxID=1295528 RepID=A0A1E3J320_9TREE|nr:hypothetical protein L198_04632 [Cryptococcus wingfieldii CBS 7118]ODN95244.1 hypothetical protein L198_04632 [Cryptococcus wingfieldii CBS 7118]
MFLLAWVSLLFLPFIAASSVSTIYWPVSHPDPNNPWVIGENNPLAWKTGGGTGVQSFDIQLHNANKTVMVGFLPIALRVPMKRVNRVYGGSLEVELDSGVPTGDGFFLVFMNTYHGQVYGKASRSLHSKKFSILDATPSNYTASALPTGTVTATLDTVPNPTQQWAITLDGIDADATATASATNYAGNAGSGS